MRIFTLIIKGICRLLFRVEVKGLTNLPTANGLLIVANHASFLDGLLIGLFIPKKATFVVHNEVLKHWWFRQILRLTPHIGVDPGSPYAMKQVIRLLESGQNVVIFPEGRITLTGNLMKIYDGPGFVAAKTHAPVLPIHVDGAAESYFGRLTQAHPRKLLPKVVLTISPASHITMPEPASGAAPFSAKEKRRLAGEQMRAIMQTMLFRSQKNHSLFEAFLDATDRFGRDYKLIEDHRELEEPYQELLKKSLALGRLVNKISHSTETVGVLMPNVTNTVALILGMSAFHRVPALLNYTAGVAGIQNACIAANIKTVITSRQFIETADLAGVVSKLTDVRIVYLESLREALSWVDRLWLMGFAMRWPRLATSPGRADQAAVVLFTSGSEGKPKGVVHSHQSILANISQILSVLDINATDKCMMVLPIFHAFGFTASLLTLLNGVKLFIFPSPLQYKVIPEVIYDRNCTIFFATSTFLGNYAKYAHPYDFYKLKLVVAGAEKLSEEVRKTYSDKFGIRILEGYGATECAPVISANTPMANLNGSVGQLMPGMHARLDPVEGIKNGGLLLVKGDNIMMGYYLFDQPGILQPPADGWYNTGDIVEIDAAGFLYVKGRVKRFAKIAGEMVSLETVEKIAETAAPDFEHAAITQSDSQRGESIMLYTTDPDLKREDLQIVAKNLGSPEIAIARKIIYIDNIPLLGTGKTDYVTLKQLANTAPQAKASQ